MQFNLLKRRNLISGILLAAVGIFAAVYAQRYNMGSLARMGPGFFPVVLGVLLGFIGIALAAVSLFEALDEEPIRVEWRKASIILGSILIFALLLRPAGLILATGISTFIATLADQKLTFYKRALITFAVTVITVVIFYYLLNMRFSLGW